jgi:hypothetical protein
MTFMSSPISSPTEGFVWMLGLTAPGKRIAHSRSDQKTGELLVIEVIPILDDAVGDQRQSYLMLFAAIGCVLLIACANIANLLLARLALSASQAHVIRQMVTESMVVALPRRRPISAKVQGAG